MSDTITGRLLRDDRILVLDRDPTSGQYAARSYDVLTLDVDLEHGTIELCTEAHHGGDMVPMRVWHGIRRRYTLASAHSGALAYTREELVQAVEDLMPLAERVIAGGSIEGGVGRLTDDAAEADRALAVAAQSALPDWPTMRVWDAREWLEPTGLHGWPAGTSLDDAVRALEAEAEAEHIVIDGDLREALLDIATEYLERHGHLDDDKLLVLVAEGRITAERAAEVTE